MVRLPKALLLATRLQRDFLWARKPAFFVLRSFAQGVSTPDTEEQFLKEAVKVHRCDSQRTKSGKPSESLAPPQQSAKHTRVGQLSNTVNKKDGESSSSPRSAELWTEQTTLDKTPNEAYGLRHWKKEEEGEEERKEPELQKWNSEIQVVLPSLLQKKNNWTKLHIESHDQLNAPPDSRRFEFSTVTVRHETQHSVSRRGGPRKTCERLRVLFFGADEMSSVVLRDLAKEMRQRGMVRTIHVIRNADSQAEHPFKHRLNLAGQRRLLTVIRDLKMPHTNVDSTNFGPYWDPPELDREGEKFNILISVGFAMDIPGRIIRMAQYGALKMHFSLLPQ